MIHCTCSVDSSLLIIKYMHNIVLGVKCINRQYYSTGIVRYLTRLRYIIPSHLIPRYISDTGIPRFTTLTVYPFDQAVVQQM